MPHPTSPYARIHALRASQRGHGPSLSDTPRRDRTREAAPEAVAARAKRQAASLAERNAFDATMHARGDYRSPTLKPGS